MSRQTTMSEMKKSAKIVIGMNYCTLQFLLKSENPAAYAARREGWACDLYHVGFSRQYAIVTGYSYDRATSRRLTIEQKNELREMDEKCKNGDFSREQKREMLMYFFTKHFPL